MQYNITEINHLIRHRRSVFPNQFMAGKKIDDNIIKEILINATWAPNHAHTEPWFFKVFCNKGLQTFANFQSELYKKAGMARTSNPASCKMVRPTRSASRSCSRV